MPRYKAILDDQGNPQRDLRDISMDDWGMPTVNEAPVLQPSSQFSPMRGRLSEWSPGEFSEWKQSHLTGMPTMFGNLMQQRFKRNQRGLPMAPGQLEQEENALLERYPDTYEGGAQLPSPQQNPAFKSLLHGMRKR